MTAPRLKLIATLWPLDRPSGNWSLSGHLVVGSQHIGTMLGKLEGWHFEPATEKTKRGRKHDDAQRIAVHLAYAVSGKLEKTESARRIRAANMVLMGNAVAPDNQERSVRRKLSEQRLKSLLASVGKNGGGVAFVIAHAGKGHSAFLIEREMPKLPPPYSQGLQGLKGWFWQEGMRAAEYGTLSVKTWQS
jgi:hypothetical protein